MTVAHTDVGAYALGLLEEDDRRAFERHLAGCPACAAEVEGFAGIRELLLGAETAPETAPEAAPEAAPEPGADPDSDHGTDLGTGTGTDPGTGPEPGLPPAPPPGDGVITMLGRRGRAERRRRRVGYAVGAVAAGVLLAAGLATGAAVGGDDASRPGGDSGLAGWGERRSATDPATGAAGTVALERKAWGTHVATELRNVRGPLTCTLFAVTRSGARQQVTSWTVPREGYGVPGSPAPLLVHGGAQAPRDQLTRLEVRVDGGGTLVTIPV